MRQITKSKKGFTLAELLIVVAIIGVLVGISIPIFSAQLRKSKLATNQANARAAYAAVSAEILDKGYAGGSGTYSVEKAALTGAVTENTGTTTGTAAIKTWGVDTTLGSSTTKMGDDVISNWAVEIDSAGNVSITPA